MDFIEFWHHPKRIFQALRHFSRRVFAGGLSQIRLHYTGLSFSPPTMLLPLLFVLTPAVVSHLNSTAVALNHGHATLPTIGRCVVTLAVLLLGNGGRSVGVDAFLLFVESLVANPIGNALALLGRDLQFGEIFQVSTGGGVRRIASHHDTDLAKHSRCVQMIDISLQCSHLRGKNRGGKPRSATISF